MQAPQNIRHIAKRYADVRQGQKELPETTKTSDPFASLFWLSAPYFFLLMSGLALCIWPFTISWWQSGAPLLSFSLMSAKANVNAFSTALLIASLLYVNLAYALCSTSWLFLRLYKICSIPALLMIALTTNLTVQKHTRRLLRFVLRSFHFCDDKLAFFDLPALNIDTGDVPCLLVIRGFTFHISRMTLEVHGIEVGVRLSGDIEIAIQAERFEWRILREINISEVYANVKVSSESTKEKWFDTDQDTKKATEDLTDSQAPRSIHRQESATQGVSTEGDHDDRARSTYKARMKNLEETNTSIKARKTLNRYIAEQDKERAAIGALIHDGRSVPNPPKRQMKSSELEARIPWVLKEFFRRFPVMLRLFLNPVSYNHPVHFDSIILTGCGNYLAKLLQEYFFETYDEQNKVIAKLESDVTEFLQHSKFGVVLSDVLGLASVPFLTQYDIITFIKVPKLKLFRVLYSEKERQVHDVQEAVELEGVAATFTIPSALLPHHEDLLPPPPSDIHERDCLNVKMSILGSLPGKFHAEMIEFAITMLKASEILTLEKGANSMSQEVDNIADLGKKLGKAALEQTKKKLVEAHVDDEWLHKLILKGVNAMRTARGDVGYQMDIPVDLDELRPTTYVRRSSDSK